MTVDINTARAMCGEQLGMNLEGDTVRAWRAGRGVTFRFDHEFVAPTDTVVYSPWFANANVFEVVGWIAGGAMELIGDVEASKVPPIPRAWIA